MMLLLSWPITISTAFPSEQIFLTEGQFKQLEQVSSGIKFSNTPIFMFNDVDEYAGGLAQLYDNWVSAKVGTHLSYLGLIDYLDQIEQTPYSQIVSRQASAYFAQQLRDSGVTTRTALLQHPIVIMSEFYRPYPLPSYSLTFFNEFSPGIYIDNATRLNSLANVTLPLYMIFGTHSGTWGGLKESWSKSIYAYEVNDSVPKTVEAPFLFSAQSAGTFTLGLRYWDGNGNSLSLAVDGQTVGTIRYNNTDSPALRLFSGVFLSEGVHTLAITINNNPSSVRYASLDFLVLTTP
jgi:hypothetical protein